MSEFESKRRQLQSVLEECSQRGDLAELATELIMTPNPTCVDASATAEQVVYLIHERGFRHLLVIDARKQLLGVISDRDMIRCFGFGAKITLNEITAARLMSSDLITIERDAPFRKAVEMMLAFGINCLPVCNGETPVGIVTSTDVFLLAERLLGVSSAAQSS